MSVLDIFTHEELSEEEIGKISICEVAQGLQFKNKLPSTVVRITYDDYERLLRLIPVQPNGFLPSDILDGNIVPIRSLAIEFDHRAEGLGINKVVFHVLDQEEKELSELNMVLSIIFYDETRKKVVFGGAYSFDNTLHCFGAESGVLKGSGLTTEMYTLLLQTWYGIQISLLHPTIKEVFRHSGIMSDKEREESKDYKKRPLFYQKVKTINQREFDEVVKRSINRKALIWYVIGHWRTYKNGKRIFIQPYWKGALRETKATDTPRERVI